ncbi:MAG: hypothetical protein SPD15_04815 [Allisonella histaminiformans]|uniref:hypothetical protein n=1 Tax=Allisonella histaminiformans TaxID=209880 RepID=UPI002A9042BD|nr:hypothetical protein [Allisonella histaminiformans]
MFSLYKTLILFYHTLFFLTVKNQVFLAAGAGMTEQNNHIMTGCSDHNVVICHFL